MNLRGHILNLTFIMSGIKLNENSVVIIHNELGLNDKY